MKGLARMECAIVVNAHDARVLAADLQSAFAGVRTTVAATEPIFAEMARAFRDIAETIPIPINMAFCR